MKKRSWFALMLVTGMAVCLLAGCNAGDGQVEAQVTSEIVSEKEDIPVEASEVFSEEVSEEVSEEPAAEVDYSAETIIALCDELAQKYIYDDSEYIKSLVIAGNLDYITEEDLNTVLTTWGYTMEDLAVIYEEGIESASDAYAITNHHMNGSEIEFNDEVDYANRILFQDVMLNPLDKELAAQFDECAIASSEEQVIEFWSEGPTTSCEVLLSSAAFTLGYGELWQTPYAEYVPESEQSE